MTFFHWKATHWNGVDQWIRSAEWYRQTPFRFELCLPLSVLFVFICFFFVFVISFLLSCVIRGLWCCLSARIIYDKEILGVKSRSLTIDLSGKKKSWHTVFQNAPKNMIFPKRMVWKSCMPTTLLSYFIIIIFFFFIRMYYFGSEAERLINLLLRFDPWNVLICS